MDRAGPARLKTVELPRQKYPEACVWQPTSYLLVIWEFFVEYTFIGIWVSTEKAPNARERRRPSIVGSVASGNGATAAMMAQPAKAAATPHQTVDCKFRFVFGDDA